ncbi:MAG: CDP-6-deoxy-delta-3,4-glucoseen reductase [Rhodocyclaceae bacterium]|nr:CDP-6-deoxy-delta-3,4-glucoseen reductase [Rhodocyclaceae bacterium]
MAYHVTLEPSGHAFRVEADQTILAAALDAGLHLPYGCRSGACGACKAKILAGSIDPGTPQEQALTRAERNQGYALLCSARPLSDLTIEIQEVKSCAEIPVRTLPCRVESLERAAPDVMIVKLKLPSQERLPFLPGQYIEFLLEGGKRRAFSLANPPHADQLLELHIRHVPGGNFTEHVFSRMKVKDILRIEGPHGSFYLREESDKPILLVAGGTGFAPIKSIIEHALHVGLSRPMTLYWGARNSSGLYLHRLAERWAQTGALRYIPVLSEPDADWSGRTGLVHQAVLADLADLSDYEAYVCGAPAMVEAAKRDFCARGLPEHAFFADVFSYAPR